MIRDLLSEFAASEVRYQMGGIPLSKAYSMCDFAIIEKMSANENNLGVSPKAMNAVKQSVDRANFYPDLSCFEIKEKLSRQYEVPSNQIILTHGGTVALTMIGEVFLRPGDEIVYATPTYQAYQNMARKGCAKIVEVPMNEDYRVDFDLMSKAISEKTKLVIICNPNNPTAGYEEEKDVISFIDTLPKNVVVLVDEAYIQFAGKEKSLAKYISPDRNLIVLQTFSKIYGMAGFRLGYVMSNEEIIGYLNGDMDAYDPNILALIAGDAALDDTEFVDYTLSENKKGREYITTQLEQLGVKVYPSFTNFIMFDAGIPAYDLTVRVLKEAGVLIRGTFENPRVTIGTMEQNQKFISAMKRILM